MPRPPFGAEHDEPQRPFVREFEIHNFRGIDHAKITLPERGNAESKVTGSVLFLSENAVGTTSILQAMALDALGPVKAAAQASCRIGVCATVPRGAR